MPRGDRTGPWGLGPRTGRGAGYCNGYPVPGFMNPAYGFGRGMGVGRGRGMGRRFAYGFFPPSFGYGWLPPAGWGAPFPGVVPTSAAAPDVEALKQQAAMLESQLQAVKAQMQASKQQGGRGQEAPDEEEDL